MAKMKTFAVDVEVVSKYTLIVSARRAGGVEVQLSTEAGWRDAVRYQDNDTIALAQLGSNAKVVNIRVI